MFKRGGWCKIINVLEPERYLTVEKSGEDNTIVNFTCSAFDVYPSPKLILYKDNRDDFYNKWVVVHLLNQN